MAAKVRVLWMWIVLVCSCESTTTGDYDLSVILAGDTDDGVVITWKSSNGRPEGSGHATVGNHDFPQECGLSKGINRCNILTLPHPLSLPHTFVMLSVEDGIFALRFDSSESDSLITDPEGFLITWSDMENPPNCQPTALSYYQEGHTLPIVVCVNDGSSSILVSFLELQLNVRNLSSSVIDTLPLTTLSLTSDHLTSFIGDADTNCFGGDINNILFASDYTLRLFSTANGFAEEAGDLDENCLFAEDLRYFGGETVLAYCPDQIAERFDVCTVATVMVFNQSTTGIPVPCSSWDTVAYRRNDSISVPPSTDGSFLGANFTFDEPIEDAQCIIGENDTYIIVLLENTTVIAVEVSTGKQYTLANRSCDGDTWCYTPKVWDDRYLGYTNGTHFLVNDLYCLINPEILAVEFIPHSVELLIGPNPPEVQCIRTPPTSSVTEVQSTSTPVNPHSTSLVPTPVVRTSVFIDPVSTIHLTPSSTSVTELVATMQTTPKVVIVDAVNPGRSFQFSDTAIAIAVTVLIAAILLIVVIVLTTILIWKKLPKCHDLRLQSKPSRSLANPPYKVIHLQELTQGFTNETAVAPSITVGTYSASQSTDLEPCPTSTNQNAVACELSADTCNTDNSPSPSSQKPDPDDKTVKRKPLPLASPSFLPPQRSNTDNSPSPSSQKPDPDDETVKRKPLPLASPSFLPPQRSNTDNSPSPSSQKPDPDDETVKQKPLPLASPSFLPPQRSNTDNSPSPSSQKPDPDDETVKRKPLSLASPSFLPPQRSNTANSPSPSSQKPDPDDETVKRKPLPPASLLFPPPPSGLHCFDDQNSPPLLGHPPSPSEMIPPPGLYGLDDQSEENIVSPEPVSEATTASPNAQPARTDTTVVGTFQLVPSRTLDPQDQARRRLRPEDD